MGKGDKRTRKGKRIIGTWGVHRPRTDKNSIAPVAKKKKPAAKKKAAPKKETKKEEVEIVTTAETPKKEATKKAAPKKEVAKDKKSTSNDISSNTVAELKAMAKEKGIKGYTSMKKAELIAALS